MRIQKQLKTERRKALEQKKVDRKQRDTAYYQDWHPKFMIYCRIEELEHNKKTHVWFETIERKGTVIDLESWDGIPPHWHWQYRLPQNDTMSFGSGGE